MLKNLQNYEILLASKSPRRRELLKELRINFRIMTIGGIDENYPEEMRKEEVPQYLANKKADAYMDHISERNIVITADTLVICDNRILGKPRNATEAIEMLETLSGKTHKVVSGVCLASLDKRVSFSTTTEVTFSEISEDEARYYVETFMPLDKAGAYGIQEWIGCVAVEKINGSFYNVMGLPVHRLYKELKNF
ncbi:MAG: septum formation protein Maf [Bacteroidales bacterium]|nr:septum formation protein Maf [Bacteroidales bacterium]MDE6230017.1 Maf family nucleotide pyrophosphatase [Muribaculaceae bacterium]